MVSSAAKGLTFDAILLLVSSARKAGDSVAEGLSHDTVPILMLCVREADDSLFLQLLD